MCDGDAAWEFVTDKPQVTTYSYLILFAILAVLTSVTWRPFLSAGILFCVLSIIAFINEQKFSFRAAPLLPEEFQMADQTGNLVQFIDIEAMQRLIFGTIFVLIGSIVFEFLIDRLVGRKGKHLPWWNRFALIPRLTFTMMSLAFLASICSPIIHRKEYEWLKEIEYVAWNQTDNYEKNGFVIGFLYNLGATDVKQPEDYSESTIASIAKKYQAAKAADIERIPWQKAIDNVVIILAETFYEPAFLTEYYDHGGGDITPNLHALFREYPSGYMYSPEYGGGTANVEFEVQTGLTNYWAMTVPYVNLVSKFDSLLSPADYGKNYGFSSTGVHSYDGSMYKRNLVYKIMNYDGFIDESAMTYQEKDGQSSVYNDRSVYSEIIDLLENSNEPMLISAITMQNHTPYTQAEYDEHNFPVYDQSSEHWWSIESSYESLYRSDQYLEEFIEALDELDERTVVLWFGDHAMGNLEEYASSDIQDERNLAHLTPYFIYTNFDIEEPYTVKEVAKMNAKQGLEFDIRGVNLPTTTPNCLLNTMYNTLNLEKPALFYLVDKVCDTTPILSHAYDNGDGPKPTEALKEYELVNYDILHGKQYWDGE